MNCSPNGQRSLANDSTVTAAISSSSPATINNVNGTNSATPSPSPILRSQSTTSSRGIGGGVNMQQKDTTFTKIFVGGLPYSTTDESLGAFFEIFGPIEEAVVITDRQTGRSRGYGFVTMSRQEDALKAIRDPNPCIDGRKANVNLAVLGAKPRILPGVNCLPMPLIPFQPSAQMMPNNQMMNPLLTSTILSNLGLGGGHLAAANGIYQQGHLQNQQLSMHHHNHQQHNPHQDASAAASNGQLLVNGYTGQPAQTATLGGIGANGLGQQLSPAALAQLLLSSNVYCQPTGAIPPPNSPAYQYGAALNGTGYHHGSMGGGSVTASTPSPNGGTSMYANNNTNSSTSPTNTGGINGQAHQNQQQQAAFIRSAGIPANTTNDSVDAAFSTALAYQQLLSGNTGNASLGALSAPGFAAAAAAYGQEHLNQQQHHQQLPSSAAAAAMAAAALFGVDPLTAAATASSANSTAAGGDAMSVLKNTNNNNVANGNANNNGNYLDSQQHQNGITAAAQLNLTMQQQHSYAVAAAHAIGSQSSGSSMLLPVMDNGDGHQSGSVRY